MDYADIREGVYNRLCAQVGTVSNRVFWEWTAPADTIKPFLEMAFLGEISSPNKCGLHMQLEVLVFGDQSDILAIDPVAEEVVVALDYQIFLTPDGRYIECAYMHDSRMDVWVEKLNAAGIRLKFWIPSDYWI